MHMLYGALCQWCYRSSNIVWLRGTQGVCAHACGCAHVDTVTDSIVLPCGWPACSITGSAVSHRWGTYGCWIMFLFPRICALRVVPALAYGHVLYHHMVCIVDPIRRDVYMSTAQNTDGLPYLTLGVWSQHVSYPASCLTVSFSFSLHMCQQVQQLVRLDEQHGRVATARYR